MLNFKEYILTKSIQNLDYLQKTYCGKTASLSLEETKQKHKEYMFNIIRVIRRCLETQILSLNNNGVLVFSSCVSLLQQLTQYNQQLSSITTMDALKEQLDTLMDTYIKNVAALESALEEQWYPLNKDLTARSRSSAELEEFGTAATQNIRFVGHHINLFLPYLDEEIAENNYFSYFFEKFKRPLICHAYSYGQKSIPKSLFNPGKHIYGSRDRINIPTKQFDLIMLSRNAAFDGIRPKFMTAINYGKPGASMCLFGYSTNFELIDIKRLATNLENIHVYFIPYCSSPMINDKLYCVIYGTITDTKSGLKELPSLLDKFIEHHSDTEPYQVLGSAETTEIIFQSYDMMPEEYIALSDDITTATKTVLSTLFPKITTDTQQPLLPFNAGQLGLILISGEINGIIREEKSGCCHVVKGSSVQTTSDPETETVYDDDNNTVVSRTTSRTTHATTTVNIVLPSGEIRTLR